MPALDYEKCNVHNAQKNVKTLDEIVIYFRVITFAW